MTSFKLYFEDFNNWRSPVNCNQSGPDIIDYTQKATPTAYGGTQGTAWQGGQEQISVKMPIRSRKKLSQLLKRLKMRKESTK